jgi:hypothetical protein
MLASSVAEMHPAQPGLRCIVNPQGDGGKKARPPGRARISLKPLRRESRNDPVVVIASEAKQSTYPLAAPWIASLRSQ